MAASLERLTLTTASPLCLRLEDLLLAAPGTLRFPGISAKLVRKCEITGIFHRCKIFLSFFANFCKRAVWYGGNESRVLSRELRVGRAPRMTARKLERPHGLAAYVAEL